MLSSEFCHQPEKILAIVQTLEQVQLDTGAQGVPSHRSMNGHVYTSSQKGFSEDEAEAPTMEERCADPLAAVETDSSVGIRKVENQGGFSHEDSELDVDKVAKRDGSAMGKHYKDSPMASFSECRPDSHTKLGWYLAKRSDWEHDSWPHVDVSPRCTQTQSESGENRIEVNCDQSPPPASSSRDLDDLRNSNDFAQMEASSSSDSSSDIEEAASASSTGSSSSSPSSLSSSSSSSDEKEKTEVSRESGWQTPFQTLLSLRLESIKEGTRKDSAGDVSQEEEEENVKRGMTSFFPMAEAGSDVKSAEYDTDVDDWVAMERVMYSKPKAIDTKVDDWVAMEIVMYSKLQASSSGMCSAQFDSAKITSEPEVAGDMDYQIVLSNRQAVLNFWALASTSLRRQLEKFLRSSMYQLLDCGASRDSRQRRTSESKVECLHSSSHGCFEHPYPQTALTTRTANTNVLAKAPAGRGRS